MTDAKHDRTAIAPLLLPHFPHMEEATSDEWHGFLNAATGLDVDIGARNGDAFDQWRKALAEQRGLSVWNMTPEREAKIKADGERLLAQVISSP